jgi:F-type H+-transporting ATPase subunit delta
MAEITTVARPYAEAVFKLARDTDTLTDWSGALAEQAMIAANPDMQAAIGNPNLPHTALFELFASLLRTPLSAENSNFLRLLIENGRLSMLPQIVEQFEALKRDHEGQAQATVVSAFALTEAQLAALIGTLEGHFHRKIKSTVTVDQTLIGGVIVSVGNEVLDASVRGKLAAMATALQS